MYKSKYCIQYLLFIIGTVNWFINNNYKLILFF